jgi:hypothetical protein
LRCAVMEHSKWMENVSELGQRESRASAMTAFTDQIFQRRELCYSARSSVCWWRTQPETTFWSSTLYQDSATVILCIMSASELDITLPAVYKPSAYLLAIGSFQTLTNRSTGCFELQQPLKDDRPCHILLTSRARRPRDQ